MTDLYQLVSAARAGDVAAFDELVRRFQDMAVGYATRVLGDVHLAEDAAQDAFVEAHRALAQLQDAAAFPGWFRRVVFKQCDRYRRRLSMPAVGPERVEQVASTAPGPHDALEAAERRAAVRAAVEQLPEAEREAVLLTYFGDHGQGQREIAAFLEVPLTTLKKRLYAGRQRLKGWILKMVEEDMAQSRPSRSLDFGDGVRRMIQAVRAGDVDAVKNMLQADERLLRASGGEWNRPPLHHAAERGHRAVVELLLARGVGVSDADELDNATALHWAAQAGQLDIVELLVDLGADVNDTSDDHAAGPLGWACRFHDHVDVANYLIAKGAEVDVFAAIALGRLEVVTALLAADPDVTSRQMSHNEFHRTPLHFAVEKRRLEISEALLEAGADAAATDDLGMPPLALVWVRIYDRVTPATATQESAFLELFARHGFEPDAGFDAKYRRRDGSSTVRIVSLAPLLLVSDLERAISFYTGALGFEVVFRYMDFFAGLQRDGFSIQLKTGTPDPQVRQHRIEGDHLDVQMNVSGLPALHADCVAANVEIVQPPRDMPYGREVYVADPDGYRLGFVEPW